MMFTFKVFYEDDCLYSYGKKKSKFVHAKSKEQALERFEAKYGVKPIYAV